jgi:ribonuclease Z
VFVPRELQVPLDGMLRCWREVERQGTPYKLLPMSPGQIYEIRRDFGVRCFATHHGGSSVGYALISIREKLKPELIGKTGPELVALRKSGVEIQYRIEVPLVAFLGDTTIGNVFDHPDVQNAEILITEITFFDADHKSKAKAGRHLHLDHFVEVLPKLKNKEIVVTHVSRRTGIRRARSLLRKRIGEERMQHIHFLMDFEGSRDDGDVESTGLGIEAEKSAVAEGEPEDRPA